MFYMLVDYVVIRREREAGHPRNTGNIWVWRLRYARWYSPRTRGATQGIPGTFRSGGRSMHGGIRRRREVGHPGNTKNIWVWRPRYAGCRHSSRTRGGTPRDHRPPFGSCGRGAKGGQMGGLDTTPTCRGGKRGLGRALLGATIAGGVLRYSQDAGQGTLRVQKGLGVPHMSFRFYSGPQQEIQA